MLFVPDLDLKNDNLSQFARGNLLCIDIEGCYGIREKSLRARATLSNCGEALSAPRTNKDRESSRGGANDGTS